MFSFRPSFDAKRCLAKTSSRKHTLESFLAELSIEKNETVQAAQVHGKNIELVSEKDKGKIIASVDALITQSVQLPLIIRTADCLPIFIYDTSQKVIALVHAGYKGTKKGIAKKTIEMMKKYYDCNPANIAAAIGPGIKKCCYEINPDTHEHYDLFKENMKQLNIAGLKTNNIEISHLCTACRTDILYSYRKEKTDMRLYSVIMLLPAISTHTKA